MAALQRLILGQFPDRGMPEPPTWPNDALATFRLSNLLFQSVDDGKGGAHTTISCLPGRVEGW